MGNTSLVYLTLGDSMSHDQHPEEDALTTLGRRITHIGAASLLYENCHEVWPEFDQHDLVTRFPPCSMELRASDGANIDTVMGAQLPPEVRRDVWLVTLTIGGNDLLEMVWDEAGNHDEGLRALQDKYSLLIDTMQRVLPAARLVLSTIYDPTDGTGTLPGFPERFPIELLRRLNDHVRWVAAETPQACLADLHAHFHGHGAEAPNAGSWFLPANPIEPAARGANEIRRVWWNAINAGTS